MCYDYFSLQLFRNQLGVFIYMSLLHCSMASNTSTAAENPKHDSVSTEEDEEVEKELQVLPNDAEKYAKEMASRKPVENLVNDAIRLHSQDVINEVGIRFMNSLDRRGFKVDPSNFVHLANCGPIGVGLATTIGTSAVKEHTRFITFPTSAIILGERIRQSHFADLKEFARTHTKLDDSQILILYIYCEMLKIKNASTHSSQPSSEWFEYLSLLEIFTTHSKHTLPHTTEQIVSKMSNITKKLPSYFVDYLKQLNRDYRWSMNNMKKMIEILNQKKNDRTDKIVWDANLFYWAYTVVTTRSFNIKTPETEQASRNKKKKVEKPELSILITDSDYESDANCPQIAKKKIQQISTKRFHYLVTSPLPEEQKKSKKRKRQTVALVPLLDCCNHSPYSDIKINVDFEEDFLEVVNGKSQLNPGELVSSANRKKLNVIKFVFYECIG